MILIFKLILECLIGIYILWIFYLAIMNLKRARDSGYLTGFVKYPSYLTLFIGLIVDFIINVIPCTFIFIELPKEFTVTSRLKRHINNEGWRSNVASWICMNLLNQFDPSGNHCSKEK